MEDQKSPSFKCAVDNMKHELADRLHTVIDDLKIKLQECFAISEREKIDAEKTNTAKVRKFFKVLKTKSSDIHERCLKAIEEFGGFDDLVKRLRTEMYDAISHKTEHKVENVHPQLQSTTRSTGKLNSKPFNLMVL